MKSDKFSFLNGYGDKDKFDYDKHKVTKVDKDKKHMY